MTKRKEEVVNIEDDTWLEVIEIHEEPCRWDLYDCPRVATHWPVMSVPCSHDWNFCLAHRDALAATQNHMIAEGDWAGWECDAGGTPHNIGVVTSWRPLRRRRHA